jgi:iron complex transport system substrate-binding protein
MAGPVTDASGAIFTAPAPRRRIVSLIPSITETLFTLGLGDAIVGVTTF